jgi:hypothetical protein
LNQIDFKGEDIFSGSSLSFLYNKLKKTDLDIEWLKSVLKPVLIRRFQNVQKREIETFDDCITFACPYCGDSEQEATKRRGNIYFDSLYFHCYNCGYHTSTYNLIKFYSLDITDEELFLLKTFKSVQNSNRNIQFDLLNMNLVQKYMLPKKDILKAFRLKNVEKTVGETYLLKRLQKDFKKFAYDESDNSVVIFNQDEDENVIGFTKRLLGKNVKVRYLSYKLSKIYTKMGIEPKDDLKYLDKISMIFDILTVNFGGIVTVFEGPFDSFLFENSCSTAGLTKSLPIEGDNLQYWCDNDLSGLKKSTEFLKEGIPVFLWKKCLKDLNITPYTHIKDLTDLLLYCKKNKIKMVDFENYFSQDRLDLHYL